MYQSFEQEHIIISHQNSETKNIFNSKFNRSLNRTNFEHCV